MMERAAANLRLVPRQVARAATAPAAPDGRATFAPEFGARLPGPQRGDGGGIAAGLIAWAAALAFVGGFAFLCHRADNWQPAFYGYRACLAAARDWRDCACSDGKRFWPLRPVAAGDAPGALICDGRRR